MRIFVKLNCQASAATLSIKYSMRDLICDVN